MEVKAVVALLGEWAHLDVIACVYKQSVGLIGACIEGLERDGVIIGALPARFIDEADRAQRVARLTTPARALMHGRIAEELRRREEICGHLLQAPGQGA